MRSYLQITMYSGQLRTCTMRCCLYVRGDIIVVHSGPIYVPTSIRVQLMCTICTAAAMHTFDWKTESRFIGTNLQLLPNTSTATFNLLGGWEI